jgi:mono/diheme cytochrome c family protein
VAMPAFRSVLSGSDLKDLTAAYKVLAQMGGPPSGSPMERGFQLARNWQCFACHGPGGSGGLPNPGSLTGFIPGWYGSDFQDLVHDRGEFNSWVRRGRIDRLDANRIATYFVTRQRLAMPSYRRLTDSELEDLWAYAGWLGKTGGGIQASAEGKP